MAILTFFHFLAVLSFPAVRSQYQLTISLESYDNSAGGGRLYGKGDHCDPFWFTGEDECDLALRICVQSGNQSSTNFGSCLGGNWVDLGPLAANQNNITFAPGATYGGWSNPMKFTFNTLQNFTLKVLAQDVDQGSRQLIDQMTCSIQTNVKNGITNCQHTRPNGYPTLLKFSYTIGTLPTLHCSDQGGWKADACCRLTCPRNFPDPLPLLIISLDGFRDTTIRRADYLQRHVTPSIQRLRDCGSTSKFMYSSYPTKTFPNHYSIITGLYPESHGIIDNHMYDPNITPASDRYFSLGSPSSLNPQWWFGEPFWNTVMKNGMIAGTYFWPGSEVKIQNMRPNYWFKYNGSAPYHSRVDTIIQWLLYPKSKRPNFMTLYFDEPDHHGHEFGPQSPQVTQELVVVDQTIDYLMTQLYANNLFHCVNVIIVADHGMKTLTGAHVDLRNYFNTSGMIAFPNAVGRIMLENSTLSDSQVVSSLKCKNSSFRVYARKDIPKRYHYQKSNRIGDVIVDTDPGLVVSPVPFPIIGNHGWDFRAHSMHALFLAHGPGFKQNYSVESFENIELYNLLSALLKINTKAVNNGTNGLLNSLLVSPPSNTEIPSFVIRPCLGFGHPVVTSCGSCNTSQPRCQLCCNSGKCQFCCKTGSPSFSNPNQVSMPSQSTSNHQLLCNLPTQQSTVSYSNSLPVQMPLLSANLLTNSSILKFPSKNCSFIIQNWTNCGNLAQKIQHMKMQNVSLYPLLSFTSPQSINGSSLLYHKTPMYDSFYSGIWTFLQTKISHWAKKYGNLLLYSGPIFDYNHDGLQDSTDLISNNTQSSWPIPTNYFSILVRCDLGFVQNSQGIICPDNSALHVLSFVLPHRSQPINCQDPAAYLFTHTAKIRDIEELSGLQFFTDRTSYSFDDALRLRLHVNLEMWQ